MRKSLIATGSLLVVASMVSANRAQVPTVVPAMEPAGWNELAQKNSNGTTTAEFHEKWVSYMAPDKSWKKIDTRMQATGTGWEMTHAPFTFQAPEFADQAAFFNSNNRYDIFSKKEITEAPVGEYLRALDASHVHGQPYQMDSLGQTAVLYPNAFPQWDADLIYYVSSGKAPALEKLVRFNSAPSADVQARFDFSFTTPPDISVGKTKWDRKKIKTKETLSMRSPRNSMRGIGMTHPSIWDSSDKSQLIDIDLQNTASGFVLTKHVPSSFFTGVTYPVFTDTTSTFFPDPDAETTSVDGEVARGGVSESFATIRSGAGTANGLNDNNATGWVYVLQRSATNYTDMYSGVHGFDTSSIPDTNVVSAWTFSFVGSTAVAKANDLNSTVSQRDLCMVNITLSSNTSLSTSDFANRGSSLIASRFAYDSVTVDDATYNTITGTDMSWINKTGVSNSAIRTGADFDNSSPSQTSAGKTWIYMKKAETTGTSADPKLTVTYAPAATTVSPPKSILIY